MTRSTYLCPDCEARQFHQCVPPSYFRDRRLPRAPGLRTLRRVLLEPNSAVDREELLAEDRDIWRNTTPLLADFQAAVSDRDLLRRIDEEE